MTALLLLVALLPQDGREIENKIRTVRVSMDFREAKLEEIATYLREITGLNIVISPKVGDKGDGITFVAKDISVKGALSLMLRPRGLAFRVRDGVLLLTTKEELDQDVVMELYDIRDLLHNPRDFPGGEFTLEDGFAPPGAEPEPPAEFPIVELVKGHTGGKSWDENPRASISLQNGILVVRQTREVHAQVRRMLAKLRR